MFSRLILRGLHHPSTRNLYLLLAIWVYCVATLRITKPALDACVWTGMLQKKPTEAQGECMQRGSRQDSNL